MNSVSELMWSVYWEHTRWRKVFLWLPLWVLSWRLYLSTHHHQHSADAMPLLTFGVLLQTSAPRSFSTGTKILQRSASDIISNASILFIVHLFCPHKIMYHVIVLNQYFVYQFNVTPPPPPARLPVALPNTWPLWGFIKLLLAWFLLSKLLYSLFL